MATDNYTIHRDPLHHETKKKDNVMSHLEFACGHDLSDTFQGAGGVGGLLAVSVDGDYYFPFYDNNGNVMGYADENRSCAARYDYDAFGNLTSSTGPLADFFPHRFSTKYLDPDLGLYYYGHRWYSPELGRWISRDPIAENGDTNLFGFCVNNPVLFIDLFGCKVQLVLFGDSLTHGVPLVDENNHSIQGIFLYSGYKRFLGSKIQGEISPRLEYGAHGYTIRNILDEYLSKRNDSTGSNEERDIAIVSLVGMNNALSISNVKQRHKLTDRENDDDINSRFESATTDWDAFYEEVQRNFTKQYPCSRFLFLNVAIPNVGGSIVNNPRHKANASEIRSFIQRFNGFLQSKSASGDPSWKMLFFPTSFMTHQQQLVDDGIHFPGETNEKLANTIAAAINRWAK